MAARTLPPFRADHVGSLLRPPDLLDARARHKAGELDDDGLREVEDAAIRDVVALQREAGLRTATDGEFRRTSWHMDFIYQLEGVDPTDQKLAVHFHNKGGDLDFEAAALSVHDRVGLGHTIFGDAFEFLQTAVEGDQVPKLTIPSPNMVHYRGGRAAIDESVYPDLEPFWADLTAAYAEQVRRVAELGCTYLQLDDTSLAYLNDPEQRALVASQGGDPDHLHEQYVAQRQRRDRRPPRRPAGDHAHVPRQLPLLVGGRGRLRLRGRGAVLPARRRRLLPGVRRRAVRRVRAAALRARGQAGRARAGHHQDRSSSRTRTTSSGASTRRRSTCRSSSSASRPSAGSPPQWRATS